MMRCALVVAVALGLGHAAAGNAAQLTLTWADALDTDAILVERAPDAAGPFVALAGVPAGTETWVDSKLEPGDTWCYRIASINETGMSPYVGPVCATVASRPAPSRPSPAQRDKARLTVRTVGSGRGTVTSAPAGIVCGSDCSQSYAAGTTVMLTATPATSRDRFSRWEKAPGCGSASTCAVTMSGAKTVRARFARQ